MYDNITLTNVKNMSNVEQEELYNFFKKVFIDENLRAQDIEQVYKIKRHNIGKICNFFNLSKSKEQMLQCREKTCLEKYGAKSVSESTMFREHMKKISATRTKEYWNDITMKSKQTKLKNNSDFYRKNKYTPKVFERLSSNEQQILVDKIKKLYIDSNLVIEEIRIELDVSSSLIKQLIKKYNIKKSQNLMNELNKKNSLKKHGVAHPSQLETSKEKVKQTKLEKYGNENFTNSKKCKQTKLEKYGNENYNNIEKISKTMIDKYKVPFYLCLQDVKENAMIKKYGVKNSMMLVVSREKAKHTKLKRYGNVNYNNRWKCMNTCLERYGVENIGMTEFVRVNNKLYFSTKYGVEYSCLLPQCRMAPGAISKVNQKLANLFKELNIEFEQEFVVKNRCYDFKLNDKLIEINPSYTHNSTNGNHYAKPKDKNYHFNKSQLASKNNFQCIHIFDWDNKEKIIQMFTPKQKLYARNCLLKEVNKNDTDYFLNQFHLQNTCKGQKYSYGLYFQDELIQIMTFGKPRYNKNYEFELLRLCTNSNYQIIGGSQKLFKHFLRELNPKSIVSYCDYSKFSGDVYKRLGMTLKNYGKPSCNWSKGIEKITNNLLNQRGFDQLFGTSFGKGTSNRDLMIEHGWVEVYDCGQSTYIWQ